MPSRILLALYLASLALLPWSWFPPFPWLHERAQWSDAIFAATAVVWAVEKCRVRQWPQWHNSYAAMAFYLFWAGLSLVASADRQTGFWKLVGMCELSLIAVITADLAVNVRVSTLIAKTLALVCLVNFVAAIAGLSLFHAGISTRLIGTYGDLTPSVWYARVQAGTIQPNMLASFCLFASAVIARSEAELSRRARRLAQAVLVLTILLTFSRSILAFGLAAAIRAARTRTQRWLTAAYALACVAAIISLTVWNLSFNPAHPLEAHLDNHQLPSRSLAIFYSFQTLSSDPMFGSGVGSSPAVYQAAPFHAHLLPLNIAATMGIPALLAFIALFVLLWRNRARPADAAIWSGLAGMALDALAEDSEDFRHLWVLIGLAAIKRSQSDNANSSASKPNSPASLAN